VIVRKDGRVIEIRGGTHTALIGRARARAGRRLLRVLDGDAAPVVVPRAALRGT